MFVVSDADMTDRQRVLLQVIQMRQRRVCARGNKVIMVRFVVRVTLVGHVDFLEFPLMYFFEELRLKCPPVFTLLKSPWVK